MISLSRHIELLLLDHNCVIVPGLGGFIANTTSAVYNDGADGDKLFMPPYRTIGFNSQLQVNDGLLVQSYMQAYDASYPAAYLQMEKEIEQLNTQLNLFGEYNLEGIGTLYKSLGQNIELSSSEAGVLTPSLYGTYSFEIKSLAEVIKEREIMEAASKSNIMPIQTEGDLKVEEKEEEKDTAAKKVIPIKKNKKKNNGTSYWVDFSIATVAAVILFFAFLIPNAKSIKGDTDTCIAGSLYSDNKFSQKTENKSDAKDQANTLTTADTKSEEQKSDAKKPEEVESTKNPEQSNATTANETSLAKDAEAEKPKTEVAATPAESKKAEAFTIVIASSVKEEGALKLIKKLESKGFREAKFIKGKTSRIIYSSYASKKEAREAIKVLSQQDKAFESAWPLKMN